MRSDLPRSPIRSQSSRQNAYGRGKANGPRHRRHQQRDRRVHSFASVAPNAWNWHHRATASSSSLQSLRRHLSSQKKISSKRSWWRRPRSRPAVLCVSRVFLPVPRGPDRQPAVMNAPGLMPKQCRHLVSRHHRAIKCRSMRSCSLLTSAWTQHPGPSPTSPPSPISSWRSGCNDSTQIASCTSPQVRPASNLYAIKSPLNSVDM